MPRQKMYVALVHYPTIDKHGHAVATSVTNLDIHDIARSARTYGLSGYFLVTPVESHHWLARKVLAHWEPEAWGGKYNPNRTNALELVRVATDLAAVSDAIREEAGREPVMVATSARRRPNTISFADLRRRLEDDGAGDGGEGDGPRPYCILLGTGWGLHPEVLLDAELTLAPIVGPTPYNHLSVRSAAAIIFDRLLAKDREEEPG